MGEAKRRRYLGANDPSLKTDEAALDAVIAKTLSTKPIPAEKLIEEARKVRQSAEKSGFKGKVNIYCCDDCGGFIVTKDLDEGTTPYTVNCQQSGGVQCADNCKGYMKSAMYRVYHTHMNPTHEWWYPADLRNVPRHLLDHVSHGGLLLRKVESKE